MAWLEVDQRTGHFKVGFRLGDRKLKRSLKTSDRDEAADALAIINNTLRAVERGWVEIPPGVDVGQFLLSGGRLTESPTLPLTLRLSGLFDAYFERLPEGNLEQSTIDGMRTHQRHLYRILGKSLDVQTLSTADLQRYIEKRSQESGRRGRKVTATTVKKAIITLRTVWNWGAANDLVRGEFPSAGLKYPKTCEKRPFQTWKEIERQIGYGGLSEAEQADLWDCLFLTVEEIDALLRHVYERARQAWIYPMVCVAAHTGSRRSEILRSRMSDLDFEAGFFTIHERKRNHEVTTTRRAPISPFLDGVLRDWLEIHPGGPQLFSQEGQNNHSSKSRRSPEPITRDETNHQLKRSLANSKWSVIRGWHIFRHSFCSNCAAKGIDQRIINGWVGHQTEDIVRRYRHLFPDQQQSAIRLVFGDKPKRQRSTKVPVRRKGK